MDAMHPTASVLAKLGSVARHVEEFLSPSGHPLDKMTLEGLIEDPELQEWMEHMDALGLLPVLR